MLDFIVTTPIHRPPPQVWNYLIDIQRWWLPSNPDHEGLDILSPGDAVGLGTELRVRERIAGVFGEATGKITEFVPDNRATWEAHGRYRFLGWHIDIEEGVTWSVRPSNERAILSAHVWARFPETFTARVFEWLFIHALRGRERDRRHAKTELEYIRAKLEEGPAPFGSA